MIENNYKGIQQSEYDFESHHASNYVHVFSRIHSQQFTSHTMGRRRDKACHEANANAHPSLTCAAAAVSMQIITLYPCIPLPRSPANS